MIKGYLTVIFLFILYSCSSQQKTFTESEKASLDSLFRDDEFVQLMKASFKPKSYFTVSTTLGNSYFSLKNKSINASQLESKTVFTPGLSYIHKSGLGISAAGFLSSFKDRTGFYQYTITPLYTLKKNKRISLTISYTRLIARAGYKDAASPIQNDLYAVLYLKKLWLEPGLAIGFSSGKKTDYRFYDTVLFTVRRTFTDTIKSSIESYSMTAFVQHSFEFYRLLSKKDGISILPKILLNAGKNNYTEKHYNPYSAFFKKLLARRKSLGRLQDNSSFELQSVACSIDINYIIGKFGFEPQVYLDYYLPSTTDKRLTSVYSFGINYTF